MTFRGSVGTCILRVLLLLSVVSLSMAKSAAPSFPAVFQEVWQTVADQFFDAKLNGVDWQAARERYSAQVERAQTPEEFAAVVNQMLSLLQTSHTHYYTPQSPEYFQLAGIFWPVLEPKLKTFLPDGRPDYPGIGAVTVSRGEHIFISDVLSGSAAAAAGVKTGDEIMAVDGKPFHPINSFRVKAEQRVAVQILRTRGGTPETLFATPRLLDPTTMFLEAMKASVETLTRRGVKIGYVHVWSYAGEIYQDQLEEELDGRLHDTDGLIVDLRNGWGGASPAYLRPFFVPPMTIEWTMRNGKRMVHEEAYTKPVCLLVNEGTRSGKELLTYYFKKAHRGVVVGSQTAGAVLPGKPFVLSDGSLLFLAVGDGLVDGKRPEGKGVTPDVDVPFAIEYAGGNDPQKERALEIIAKRAHPE